MIKYVNFLDANIKDNSLQDTLLLHSCYICNHLLARSEIICSVLILNTIFLSSHIHAWLAFHIPEPVLVFSITAGEETAFYLALDTVYCVGVIFLRGWDCASFGFTHIFGRSPQLWWQAELKSFFPDYKPVQSVEWIGGEHLTCSVYIFHWLMLRNVS